MSSPRPINLTIIGSGALANLFGSRLAAHADVTLVGSWEAGIRAIAQHGITVETATEQRIVTGVNATTRLEEVPPAQIVLVLVKSWQTGRAADWAARLLAPDGAAVTIQNGLGNYETLVETLGAERVVQGVTTQGAALLNPGHIRYAGGGETTFGKLPDSASPASRQYVQKLVDLLNLAEIPARLAADVDVLLWGKLAINAAINPLSALLRVPNGALLEHVTPRNLMLSAAEECAAVARARGIQIDFDVAERVREVARLTAMNYSSMLQDVLRGAQTEIDAINGAIVAAGEAAGVATPVNAMLTRLVRAAVALDGHRITL